MCPFCRSLVARWERTTGTGTIWSFVVPHPPLLPAYADLAPYNVIVVALDEDPTIRMVGNLLASPDGAINEVDPATIRIGEPVTVVFQQVDDVHLPRWVRAVDARKRRVRRWSGGMPYRRAPARCCVWWSGGLALRLRTAGAADRPASAPNAVAA